MREILRDSGLTARALARQAGWDETKCSRLQGGRTPPSDADIRTWCTICGVPDEIPNLIAASRNAADAYVEWRRVQRSQRRLQELGLELYENNTLYRFYSSNFMLWPLQTPNYMRAVMTYFNEFHEAGNTDIEEGVKMRVARRQYLADGRRTCVMVMEESVLRNRIFSNDIMGEQLRYILTVMRQSNISLGIIPWMASRSQHASETFHMYGDVNVSIELTTAIVTITQPREIDLYVKAFNELRASAVHGRAARTLITNAIEALH
ncbi:helix-turn-helix transcriptional regulator [Nonomuraea longicatena]|uniref:Helix-turn-helix transcriptional regulator n=1 Tax=Nonomuraea longicatena TaxID=83682 RepID=A0ABP3ZED6_9ACTN